MCGWATRTGTSHASPRSQLQRIESDTCPKRDLHIEILLSAQPCLRELAARNLLIAAWAFSTKVVIVTMTSEG